MLDREEYVEQAYFFRALRERMQQDCSAQELLVSLKQEALATTKLPMALDFMASELRLTGGFATAMAHLRHYFTAYQAFVVAEVEARAEVGEPPSQLIPQAERLYGQTRILLWLNSTQGSPSIPAPSIP